MTISRHFKMHTESGSFVHRPYPSQSLQWGELVRELQPGERTSGPPHRTSLRFNALLAVIHVTAISTTMMAMPIRKLRDVKVFLVVVQSAWNGVWGREALFE
jgi:hypothetical protein